MSKAKGNWATINGGGLSKVNAWKQELGKVPPPVREFKPYVPSAAMERAVERCKELTALPSRFA